MATKGYKIVKKLLLMGLALALLSACASGPTITANTTPGVDFRQFQTYNFHQPLGTDRANTGVRTTLSTNLMNIMNREMQARGLTLSDDPDLLIDFMTWTDDRIDVRQTPTTTVHQSHWHHGWTTWPTYQTTVRQWTEGSLVIDLLDPRRNMLVAEGGAQKRVSDSVDMAVVEQAVSDIMQAIWAN